jgi:hypothetical protein
LVLMRFASPAAALLAAPVPLMMSAMDIVPLRSF